MVSTPLKNIGQIGSFFQVGVKRKNVWNHHPVIAYVMNCANKSLVIIETIAKTETDPGTPIKDCRGMQQVNRSSQRLCSSLHYIKDLRGKKSSCDFSPWNRWNYMFIALEDLNPSMEGALPGRNGVTWVFDESDVFGTLTATRIYLLLENASINVYRFWISIIFSEETLHLL